MWNLFGKQKEDTSRPLKEESIKQPTEEDPLKQSKEESLKQSKEKSLKQSKEDSLKQSKEDSLKQSKEDSAKLSPELRLDSDDVGSPEEIKREEPESKTYDIYKMLNGRMPADDKDCLGCKIIATATPLGISGYLFYHMRRVNMKKIPDKYTRALIKPLYGCMAFGFLWFSFLSATSGWLRKEDEESWREFYQRDTENQKKIFSGIKTFISEKIGSK